MRSRSVAFNSINRQFTSLADFSAWLFAQPQPTWHPIGTTYHNTYRPTLAQWRGLASMWSMQSGYEAKGWTAGPHLYLALGAPKAADNGIFCMTPPTSPGIHSPSCNSGAHGRFGVEVVGDYQAAPPAPPLQQLLVEVVAVLHEWAHLVPDLNAHRDCDPRTCPGDAFYNLKPQLQSRLVTLMVDPWPLRWGPIAPPDQTSWQWDIPRTWKLYWQRLGKCISSALYDNAHGLVVQCFEGGDIRQRTNKPPEVTFR